MAEAQQKRCFIISPIGSDDSDIRIAADFFREEVVKATLRDQFEVKRADDYPNAGNITTQVIEAISKADLIIADLTGRNANVYYELGVAHSYKRHVVPMINRDIDPNPPPFDVHAERTIPYSLKTVATKRAAREALASAVEATLKGDVSNPVTTALGLAKATAEGDKSGQLLDQLMRAVVSLELRSNTQEMYIRELNDYVRQPKSDGEKIANALTALGRTSAPPPVDFLTGRGPIDRKFPEGTVDPGKFGFGFQLPKDDKK